MPLTDPKFIIESVPSMSDDSWFRRMFGGPAGGGMDARYSLSLLPASVTAAVALGTFPTLAEYAIDIAKAKEAERRDLDARDAERQFKANTIEYGGGYAGNRAARRRALRDARRHR